MRRRGKEVRERLLALILILVLSPVFAACAVAIKLESLFSREARGPVFFVEKRISRGRVINLMKFRILNRSALDSLGSGPTHIAILEQKREVTWVGRVLKQWYLDELPQLWNIIRGDMFLIGTRPYPLEMYEDELRRGITRKRDMPAGLVGPVQSNKGRGSGDQVDLDLEYWEQFQTVSAWKLLLIDIGIVWRSLQVQLEHRGL